MVSSTYVLRLILRVAGTRSAVPLHMMLEAHASAPSPRTGDQMWEGSMTRSPESPLSDPAACQALFDTALRVISSASYARSRLLARSERPPGEVVIALEACMEAAERLFRTASELSQSFPPPENDVGEPGEEANGDRPTIPVPIVRR
jgi:hypothetical protein